MLKYQVRTLGRDRRRQSTPLRDVFTGTATVSSSPDSAGNASATTPNSPWRPLARTRGRSTSVSSLSSASTSSDTAQEWATIRIYTSSVRPDTDYKTLLVNVNATATELIRMVMHKFRIQVKDPGLFYLTMQLTTKHEGNDVRHAVALDSNAKPLVLQACYPANRCRFELHTRQSFPIRIYDSSLCTESNYKTIMVSRQTTCAEVVRMLMKSRLTRSASCSASLLDNIVDDEVDNVASREPSAYGIALVDIGTRKEIMLHPEESVFTAMYESGARDDEYCQFHLQPLRRRRFESPVRRVNDFEQAQSSFHRINQRLKIIPPKYDSEDHTITTLAERFGDEVL